MWREFMVFPIVLGPAIPFYIGMAIHYVRTYPKASD